MKFFGPLWFRYIGKRNAKKQSILQVCDESITIVNHSTLADHKIEGLKLTESSMSKLEFEEYLRKRNDNTTDT